MDTGRPVMTTAGDRVFNWQVSMEQKEEDRVMVMWSMESSTQRPQWSCILTLRNSLTKCSLVAIKITGRALHLFYVPRGSQELKELLGQ